MAYSLKFKEEVLNQINQGSSVIAVSQKYEIARQTIYNWLKSPGCYPDKTSVIYKFHDLEEKVNILRLVEAGSLSVHQIAEQKNMLLFTDK